jgi:uncharacterized protein YjeT (DUF2065 family)
MWKELAIAFSLVLVIEGILPFAYPARWRKLVMSLADVNDSTMRTLGLLSMLAGLLILYVAKL